MINQSRSSAVSIPFTREQITEDIHHTIKAIGQSAIYSNPYDTSWMVRLALQYPGLGFENALEWLRSHQHADGSWGSDVLHHHDRSIGTLAAITALKLVGHFEDKERIERGVNFLWFVSGRLHHDANDTIGFPVLSVPLINEAIGLGLDVPRDLYHDAATIEKKLNMLSHDTHRWRYTTMAFSLEAIRASFPEDADFLEANGSVGLSPAATAALLLYSPHPARGALDYLVEVATQQGDGGVPNITPIDVFEALWTINYVRQTGAITPDDPEVRRLLDILWAQWSTEPNQMGLSLSKYFSVPDLDDTAVGFSVLKWGGYPVKLDAFDSYEEHQHFHCYPGEIDISLNVNIRTLAALRVADDHPKREEWIAKIIKLLRRWSVDGHFWFDKWHTSPYYLAYSAVNSIQGLADDLLFPRIKWILRTQHRDGGWGYYNASTPEETAYCLQALLHWDRHVERVDAVILDNAARYLCEHYNDEYYVPLWIGKCLYTPHTIVRAAVLSAIYSYLAHRS